MNSKVGMILGGAIVVFVGLLIMILVFFPSPSDPTSVTKAKGALARYDIPLSIATVLGHEPSEPGNAGEDYKAALDSYRANRTKWSSIAQRMADAGAGAIISEIDLVSMRELADHCHRGARKAKMEFSAPFGGAPVMAVNQADSVAFERISDSMLCYALYHWNQADENVERNTRKKREDRLKDAEKAETILKDWFVMGWHLTQERAYPATVAAGFLAQEEACFRLEKIYEQYPELISASPDRIARVREYGSEARLAGNTTTGAGRLWAMWTPNPKPGDYFNVIENGKDPSWRVQALLGLGIVKWHNEGHRGDRRYTQKLLEKYAKSGTELEKRAAKASLEFTRDQYRLVSSIEPPEP